MVMLKPLDSVTVMPHFGPAPSGLRYRRCCRLRHARRGSQRQRGASRVSVMLVVAAAGVDQQISKLPPVADAIVR